MNRSILTAAFAIATVGTLVQSDDADAGRYRFGGGGRVHARVHVGGPSVSVRYARPAYRPHYYNRGVGVSGRIYVGPRYNYYPRYSYPTPRYYYYYQPVPSYYGVYSQQSYYPVQPATPATTAIIAPVARPELPRFGIGLFAGGASVEGTDGFDTKQSSDVGLLGRFRLTPGLILEAEVGKQSYEENLRVDRRMGASLVYEIGAYNKLAPYVLAGVGVQQAEVDGQFETRQNFGEVGIGLRYAATPRFHVLFDVRAGSRATAESDDVSRGDAVTRQVTPPSVQSDEAENYTRARLGAVLYF